VVILGRVSWWMRRLGRLARQRWEILLVPVGMVAFVGLWALVRWLGDYPTFILPAPHEVWAKLLAVVADGTLWYHSVVTLTEILGGLALGLMAATLLGYLLAKSPVVERLLSPYIVASQSVPIVALAPLLIIWFGFGLFSKVLVCALTIFFPVLINTISGGESLAGFSPARSAGSTTGPLGWFEGGGYAISHRCCSG